MLTFTKATLINAPVDIVWQFYERPDILEKLTPPWQPVTIINRKGGLEIGATTEFLIDLVIFKIHWLAEHIDYQKPHLFIDIQKDGPMLSWRHEHLFIETQGKTLLKDIINYEIPGGDVAEFLLQNWVNSRLEDMFAYRHQVTKIECENK